MIWRLSCVIIADLVRPWGRRANDQLEFTGSQCCDLCCCVSALNARPRHTCMCVNVSNGRENCGRLSLTCVPSFGLRESVICCFRTFIQYIYEAASNHREQHHIPYTDKEWMWPLKRNDLRAWIHIFSGAGKEAVWRSSGMTDRQQHKAVWGSCVYLSVLGSSHSCWKLVLWLIHFVVLALKVSKSLATQKQQFMASDCLKILNLHSNCISFVEHKRNNSEECNTVTKKESCYGIYWLYRLFLVWRMLPIWNFILVYTTHILISYINNSYINILMKRMALNMYNCRHI